MAVQSCSSPARVPQKGLQVHQVLLLTSMHRPGPCHARPANERPRTEPEVSDGVGPDERGSATQARATMDSEGTAVGFTGGKKALDDVHGRTTTIFKGKPNMSNTSTLKELGVVREQMLSVT